MYLQKNQLTSWAFASHSLLSLGLIKRGLGVNWLFLLPFLQSKKLEDEFLETACSDISQLCGEMVVIWNNFVNLFTGKEQIFPNLYYWHLQSFLIFTFRDHWPKDTEYWLHIFKINVYLFTGRQEISQHLARVHHHQRVKRFSEAFFLVDQPRKSALECVEAKYNRYASLSENLRTSEYLMTLPPLPG